MCKVNVGNVVMKGQILVELTELNAMHAMLVDYLATAKLSSFNSARADECNKIANRIIDLEDAYDNDCPECMGSAYHTTKFYQQHGCCESCFWNAWDDVSDVDKADDTWSHYDFNEQPCDICSAEYEAGCMYKIAEGQYRCQPCEHNIQESDDFDLEDFYGTGDSNEEYPMLGKVEEVEEEDAWLCGDCNKLFEFSPFASITEGTCLCPSCFDDSRYEVRFVTSAVNNEFGGHIESVAKFDNELEALRFIEEHGADFESMDFKRYSVKY